MPQTKEKSTTCSDYLGQCFLRAQFKVFLVFLAIISTLIYSNQSCYWWLHKSRKSKLQKNPSKVGYLKREDHDFRRHKRFTRRESATTMNISWKMICFILRRQRNRENYPQRFKNTVSFSVKNRISRLSFNHMLDWLASSKFTKLTFPEVKELTERA